MYRLVLRRGFPSIREYRFPLNEVLLPYCRHHGLTEPEQLNRAALDRLSVQLLDEGGRSGRPLSRHTIASYLPSDRLFISLRRRPGGDYGPLTPSGVEQVIQELGASAGITKRVYPHLLRHSYATWTLTRGMNPIMLAHILGHTSLAMIQNVYSHLTPTDAYEAMVRTLAEDDGASASRPAAHLRPYVR
jgi:integrase